MIPKIEIPKYDIKITNSGSTWATWSTAIDCCDVICSGIRDGKIPNNERDEKMNILDLWERRKRDEINEKYNDIIEKEYNALDVVKEYNELINNFNINLKQLADKYNSNNNEQPLISTCYANKYSYELNMYLEENIKAKYDDELNSEYCELSDFVEEVKAILSLSDDKDYQLDVLKSYGILDKKGRLNI